MPLCHCRFVPLSAALLAVSLSAQTPGPQHLLRLTLEPGATQHYRKTAVTENNHSGGTATSTIELTLECNVGRLQEGKAELQQTVRRVVVREGHSDSSGEQVKETYDSDKGGNDMGLGGMVSEPVTMKVDERGRFSDLKLPAAMTGAASPQLFLMNCITLPDLPVAVGQTWETNAALPIPELGDREVKAVHQLVSVTKGLATIETEVRPDPDRVKLRNGGTIDKYRLTTVLELANGKLVESRLECVWSSGPAGGRRAMSLRFKLEAIAPPAKQGGAPADALKAVAVQLEARQLPVSSQGKQADAADIVLTVAHAPAGGVKCDQAGVPVACTTGEHWQVEVRLGDRTDAPAKTFALTDTELRKHLEWAASPKAKTKHADRVNVSDATLAMRVPAATAYPLVQGLLATAAAAGIHRIEFAVVPAADAAEQRLALPLPRDEGAVLVDDPKAPPQEVRIALFADPKTGACTRMFGRAKLADGEGGDAELRTKLKEATATRKMPAVIDAAPGVSWQAVVGVVDACRAAGVEVQFATAGAKKK